MINRSKEIVGSRKFLPESVEGGYFSSSFDTRRLICFFSAASASASSSLPALDDESQIRRRKKIREIEIFLGEKNLVFVLLISRFFKLPGFKDYSIISR